MSCQRRQHGRWGPLVNKTEAIVMVPRVKSGWQAVGTYTCTIPVHGIDRRAKLQDHVTRSIKECKTNSLTEPWLPFRKILTTGKLRLLGLVVRESSSSPWN